MSATVRVLPALLVLVFGARITGTQEGDLTLLEQRLQSRAGYTLTALDDGAVLIVGGTIGGVVASVVEVFDPVTGVGITLETGLSVPRAAHSATALLDGRILVVGGEKGVGPVGTAELFDLSTRRASVATYAVSARSGHAATLLSDGRVLITGGRDGQDVLGSIEILDPREGTSSVLEVELLRPRDAHSATVLEDGRVLIAGGKDARGAIATTELFDPSREELRFGPDMQHARFDHVAFPSHLGTVILAGGYDGRSVLDSIEIFFPSSEQTTALTDRLKSKRRGARALRFDDDAVVRIVGGTGSGERVVPSERLDPLRTMLESPARAPRALSRSVLPRRSDEVHPSPVLTTDKVLYVPGETITVGGAGFQPGETVELRTATRGEAPVEVGRIATDAAGSFTAQLTLPSSETFTPFQSLRAAGLDSARVAHASFSDIASLGLRLLSEGKHAEAERVFRRVVDVRPDSAVDRLKLGDALAGQGKLGDAVDSYLAALGRQPDLGDVHSKLARALIGLDRLDEALRYALEGVQRLPENAEAHEALARVHARRGSLDEAIASYEEALEADPSHTSARNDLGLSLALDGQLDQALAQWRLSLSLDPGDADASYHLATNLATSGSRANAIAVFQAGLEENPDDPRLLAGLAWELATAPEPGLRDGSRAVEIASTLYERHPNRPEVADVWASALAEVGRFDEAARVARRAIHLAASARRTGLARMMQLRLELFMEHRPYRQPK